MQEIRREIISDLRKLLSVAEEILDLKDHVNVVQVEKGRGSGLLPTSVKDAMTKLETKKKEYKTLWESMERKHVPFYAMINSPTRRHGRGRGPGPGPEPGPEPDPEPEPMTMRRRPSKGKKTKTSTSCMGRQSARLRKRKGKRTRRKGKRTRRKGKKK